LALLRARGLADGLPAIVSKRLYDTPFFRGILKRGVFDDVRLIIQDEHTFIHAQTVFSCKAMPFAKPYYDDILDKLQIAQDKNADDMLFVTRRADSGALVRILENADQISRLCHHYGFKTIDPGALSLDEQIDAFSRCRYLVGIHGANMTNMIYRRGLAMNVIEIFPPDNIPPHYYWLSKIFEYGYDVMVGSKSGADGIKGSFTVDPDALEKKLAMLTGKT
jgi:capsular polysaccharide biosynthesis protein